MARPKGVKETKPRPKGAGRKPSQSHAERFQEHPEGSAIIRLPNRLLAALERQAEAEGVTIAELIAARFEQKPRSL